MFRRAWVSLFHSLLLLVVVGPANADVPRRAPFVPDELLIRFKTTASAASAARAHATRGARVVRRYRAVPNLERIKLPTGASVEQAVRDYSSDPNVLYAEPNYLLREVAIPNDPLFGALWGLHNAGQGGGAPDADIDAPEAWDLTTGSADVVVAVIDSGIDYDHTELAANMFRNEPECVVNGIDDDGNGYIDDCHGIDAVYDDGDPDTPHDYHGTHVAGIIGARGDNLSGVVGVNWNVKILSCKFLERGSGDTADALECLDYIAYMKDHGVNVVASNNSWGGTGFSQALVDAIDAQRARGILFIAAAGNAGAEAPGFFPASYYRPNVITVAASDRSDTMPAFSNFGATSVHLAAPGHDVASTTPGSTYNTLSGTSMAAPHVTGVAALLAAQNPGRDWRAIRNLILAGADPVAAFTETTISGRRLNAYGALACSGSTVQARLRPLRAEISVSVGAPIELAMLNVDCENPAGPVAVLVEPGGATIPLVDDGSGFDQASGDGIYSGTWTPATGGTFALTFADGDVVVANVGSGDLVSPDPNDGSQFAWALAGDTSFVVAGQPSDDTGATDAGAAHLFDRLTGAPLQAFTNPTPQLRDNFGYAVAIENGYVLVGSPGDSGDAGAAYVFDADTGVLLQTLTSPTPISGAQCGFSVGFVGSNALMGCPYDDALAYDSGAVYLFDPATGALLHQFTNPTPADGEYFGWSVAASGTRLIVGAPGDGPPEFPGLHVGIVHVIDAEPSSGTFGAALRSFFSPIDGGVPRFIGHAVATLGDDVIVGDPYAFTAPPKDWSEPGAAPASGAAFVFDIDTGALRALLMPPIPHNDMLFGWAVAGIADRIVVGAPLDPFVVNGAGAAYEFEAATGGPLRIDFNPSAVGGDFYGIATTTAGPALVVGAPGDSSIGVAGGVAYTIPDLPPVERSKCYRAQRAPGTAALPAAEVVLADGIESKLTTVVGATTACNPASQSGSPIANAAARLTCHKIKDSPGQTKLAPFEVGAMGPFGFSRLTLKRAQSLCIPSGRDGGPVPNNLDRYKCYSAKAARGATRFIRRDVLIEDEFESKNTTILRPTAFCAPVSVDGGALLAPDRYLTCYTVRDVSDQPEFARPTLSTTTFLGTETLTTVKAANVCVPSQRLP